MSKRADILSAFHRHKDKTLRPRSSDGITTELCRRRGKKPPKEDIPDFSPWRERSHQFLLFLVISFSVRGLYVFLFPNCCSFDLAGWKEVGNVLLAGGNPYHLTNKLNYPPLWMQFVFVFQKISLGLNVPFYEVIKGFLILAEGLLAGLLYAALLRFTEADKAAKWLILGIAINPIAVFQVCQHCHFDVLVGFWNLLAVYMLLRFQEEHDSHFWLVACLALGLGTLTKIVPLCLAPLLLLSVRRLKFTDHVLGVVLLLGPVLLALLRSQWDSLIFM